MYANFIYFIVAIMIYATYQPPAEPGLPWWQAASAALLAVLGFAFFSRWSFDRLGALAASKGHYAADSRFAAISTRQAVMAVLLYTFMVHGLGLPVFWHDLAVFRTIPTLLALIFVLLFLALLVIVWTCAHPSYRRLYDPQVDRKAYVATNIRMSVPIILPWLVMSLVADIIFALPFATPKKVLSSTEGVIAYFLLFLVTVAVAAPFAVQRLWGCYPLEDGFFRERIRALCRRAGIRYRDILYWPLFGGRMLTAGVMGIVHRFRYILVTDALLTTLTPDEIDAVIAHEIGHVRKHHLLYFMLFMAGFMLAFFSLQGVIGYLILSARPLFHFLIDVGLTEITILYSLAFIFFFLLYFRFLFGYFMRNFERQADIFVYTLFDSADPMISTFRKITAVSGQAPDKPNWHHFSISQRVDYLQKCEHDRRWVQRHNRKVRHSLIAYCAGLVMIGILGYQLNFGQAGQAIGSHLVERFITLEIEKNPHNTQLYSDLGDLKYSRERYAEAAEAYEQAVALDPRNTQALNNLAWLYSTSADHRLRDPTRALMLARRAVQLAPESAHMLDTLAEAHLVNGNRQEAVRVSRRALAAAEDGREYYRRQLERFLQAHTESTEAAGASEQPPARGGPS